MCYVNIFYQFVVFFSFSVSFKEEKLLIFIKSSLANLSCKTRVLSSIEETFNLCLGHDLKELGKISIPCMDNRYEEIVSETWPMLPWWKWPVHRIWLPKGKKTSRHNLQKGRANPCVIQVTVRGQMDGNGVWALGINAVECYHSENLLPDVKNSAVMMVQSRHSFLALSSGENLLYESLWFSLDYKISDLNVPFFKVWFQNHIHQNDLRGHLMCRFQGPNWSLLNFVGVGGRRGGMATKVLDFLQAFQKTVKLFHWLKV